MWMTGAGIPLLGVLCCLVHDEDPGLFVCWGGMNPALCSQLLDLVGFLLGKQSF